MASVKGVSVIDSTSLAVYHNKRIGQHCVVDGIAKRGKNALGWFYGFKVHLVVNDCGDLLAFCLTTAKVDDRQPVAKLARHLLGKLFGDKGYISQALFAQLFTKLRKNM